MAKYVRPPLKTARVFGGIAGIMNAEQGDPDDLGHMPSMSSKTREIGELQDMYRRTLAASWAAQAGELPADQCIENIFAGGDGWGNARSGDHLQVPTSKKNGDSTEDDGSDEESRVRRGHGRNASSFSRSMKQRGHGSKSNRGNHSNRTTDSVDGQGSIELQANSSSTEEKARSYRRMHEIDEFEAREDLRSWEISTPI